MRETLPAALEPIANGETVPEPDIVRSYLLSLGIIIRGENDYGYRCLCPFHAERDPSFSVNRHTGYWKCFAGCGQGTFRYLLKRCGVDPRKIILPPTFDYPWKSKRSATDISVEARFPTITEGAMRFYARYISPHMVSRGFTLSVLRRFQVGYSIETGETIFPIRDWSNKLIGYIHSPGKGQYYYSGINKEIACFGTHLIHGWEGYTIICEGTTDVLRIWQLSHMPALATLGVTPNRKTIQQLVSLGKPILCLYDNDQAGRNGAIKFWKLVKGQVQMLFPSWKNEEKDPENIQTTERFSELLEKVTPFPNF